MKGNVKRIAALMLMSGLLLCGCGNSGASQQEEATGEGDVIEIGMCFDSFVIERWEKDRDVFVDTAASLGATVNVQNANGDVEKQIEQIDYLIDKNVDCLVVIPVDCMALKDVLKKANDKGIPVVSYDRLIGEGYSDLYISFDNEEVGRMLGQAIVDSGAKSVVMICGPLTDNNVPLVNDGFTKVMEQNNVQILDTFYCEGWKAELGGAYVYENGSIIQQADAIMCGNDDLAASVIRALAVSRLAGVKPVVGQDADLPACQHIVEGTQLMTVYKPVGKLAEQAAQDAVMLAKGEAIETEAVLSDGIVDVPYVAVAPVAVTADNMDKIIIEGGFHTKEDVYMNISAEDTETKEKP